MAKPDPAVAELPKLPNDLALVCAECRWRPDEPVTVGVLQAHAQTEHSRDAVPMELVVFCLRCDVEMPHRRSMTRRDGTVLHWHDCPRCHRTRRVVQKGDELR